MSQSKKEKTARSLRLSSGTGICFMAPLSRFLDRMPPAPLPPVQKRDARRQFLEKRGHTHRQRKNILEELLPLKTLLGDPKTPWGTQGFLLQTKFFIKSFLVFRIRILGWSSLGRRVEYYFKSTVSEERTHWPSGETRWVLRDSVSSPLQTKNRLRGTDWVLSPELGEGKKTNWAPCLKPFREVERGLFRKGVFRFSDYHESHRNHEMKILKTTPWSRQPPDHSALNRTLWNRIHPIWETPHACRLFSTILWLNVPQNRVLRGARPLTVFFGHFLVSPKSLFFGHFSVKPFFEVFGYLFAYPLLPTPFFSNHLMAEFVGRSLGVLCEKSCGTFRGHPVRSSVESFLVVRGPVSWGLSCLCIQEHQF